MRTGIDTRSLAHGLRLTLRPERNVTSVMADETIDTTMVGWRQRTNRKKSKTITQSLTDVNTSIDYILDVQKSEWATHIGDFTYDLDYERVHGPTEE